MKPTVYAVRDPRTGTWAYVARCQDCAWSYSSGPGADGWEWTLIVAMAHAWLKESTE
ncbi:hypothetical protein [Streptomyces sp. NPDC057854]|uniref:hypothetical protein n=1 Tax=unclassified Streptomyces TaxID=2593676 RepID=UPI003681C84D